MRLPASRAATCSAAEPSATGTATGPSSGSKRTGTVVLTTTLPRSGPARAGSSSDWASKGTVRMARFPAAAASSLVAPRIAAPPPRAPT